MKFKIKKIMLFLIVLYLFGLGIDIHNYILNKQSLFQLVVVNSIWGYIIWLLHKKHKIE